MISAAEMEVGLAQTAAFIDADPEEIVFLRKGERTRNAAGGWTDVVAGDPRTAPQRVRMIHQLVNDREMSVATTDGARRTPGYTLVGLPTSDFLKDDRFEWRGATYRIVYVHDKPDYIRKADVELDHE